ncbi:MAG: hypothetical protein PHH11_13790 [Methylomonas sp.]|nr:hypothetical protein [Methylomonas sp.]
MKGSKVLLGVLMLALTGCSSIKSRDHANAVPANEKTLTASGYSQLEDNGGRNFSQRWSSAQQASHLNAYRGLAEQLYSEPVGGHDTVGFRVVSHEAYRVYLDTYLRQARAADYRAVQDNLRSTLELKLTPRFYQCMGGDVAYVNQCIREDGKLPFTRIGNKTAASMRINLACGAPDCSDQFHVQGFSKSRNVVDGAMLDTGFYDLQWTVNTGVRILFNYLLLNGFVNAL